MFGLCEVIQAEHGGSGRDMALNRKSAPYLNPKGSTEDCRPDDL
jgi:hypothetical protein